MLSDHFVLIVSLSVQDVSGAFLHMWHAPPAPAVSELLSNSCSWKPRTDFSPAHFPSETSVLPVKELPVEVWGLILCFSLMLPHEFLHCQAQVGTECKRAGQEAGMDVPDICHQPATGS